MSIPPPPTPQHHHSPVESEGLGSRGEGRDIFFAAVEATRMPMCVVDARAPDMPIIFTNQAFHDTTGYGPAEVLGRNCRFLQGPETDRQIVSEIRKALTAEREIAVEILNYRKDGSTFWNALYIAPVRNTQGELVYFFSSQLDISRRRDAEGALRQAQKMEALGQLTGGMAHDFNNLLQVALGNIDVATVRMKMLGIADPVLEKSLRNVKEAARKGGVLTQQLLAFARKQQLQGRVINVNELVSRFSDLAGRTLGDRIEVHLDLAPELHNARVDPTQLEVALLNLMINARDAMGGAGRLTVSTTNLDSEASEAAAHGLPGPGHYVLLAVTDTGHGIPADALARVMDPFFTTKPAGTGLGLSMVYGFAKQSGGAATIYSEPDVGTTVRLYFPASVDAAETAPGEEQAAAPVGGDARIMVVDDRREVGEMAQMMLSQLGYQAISCSSPEAALEKLEGGAAVDLLLTDLIMPGGMNGVLLAREAQRRQPSLKVVLMTGFADGTPERWGGSHYDILFKPFSATDLAKKVQQALKGPTGAT